MSQASPVLIMAGGTGGHIFPALAVADSLRQRQVPVVWLGSNGGMEEDLVRKKNIEFVGLTIKGVRGKGLWSKLTMPFKLSSAVFQAGKLIASIEPQAILGLGGFASGPGGLAAILMRRRLIIQEQNAIPGMTNRYLAKLGATVLEGFKGSFSELGITATHVGNPVREAIENIAPVTQRMRFRNGPMRVFVFGGSLGAQKLNQVVPKALALLRVESRPEIYHQTGLKQETETNALYSSLDLDAEVVGFVDDMAGQYSRADLVIARAGALSVTEFMHAGLASVLVPYPHAVDDHQAVNASILVDHQAAIMIRDEELNAEMLADLLQDLLSDRDRLIAMGESAYAQRQEQSAKRVARICLEDSEAMAA